MHHWQVGGAINIGSLDYRVQEQSYTIVESEQLGQMFRAVADLLAAVTKRPQG